MSKRLAEMPLPLGRARRKQDVTNYYMLMVYNRIPTGAAY